MLEACVLAEVANALGAPPPLITKLMKSKVYATLTTP